MRQTPRGAIPRRPLVAIAAMLIGSAAHAEIVTYDFTYEFNGTAGSGYFSYDDSNTTQVSQPPGVGSGMSYYAALSFSFGGVSHADGVISIADEQNMSEVTVSTRSAGGLPALVFVSGSPGLFPDASLADLDGVHLSDFDVGAEAVDELLHRGGVTALDRVLPEPASSSLIAVALATLAFIRRRAGRAAH